MIKTKVFAEIDREQARRVGEEIGLEGKALDMFSYFNEVELEIEVDKNGVVRRCQTVGWED